MGTRFTDKVVWVTGASAGIGEALALALAAEGAQLILSARRQERLEAVRTRCPQPEQVLCLPLDLTDPAATEAAATEAAAWRGRVDILVNNAGVSQRGLALQTSMDTVRRIMEVDFFAAVHLARLVVPDMVRRRTGQVVVISSVTGHVATPMRSAYAAAKHALHGWFDALRAEVHADGVAVTLLCPGYVATDVSRNALREDGSAQGSMDQDTARGLAPDVFAARALDAIAARKREAYIGGREIYAIYLKRWLPGLLAARLPGAVPR